MKVLLLGAGASKPAGYPLASELMKTIERDAEESRNLELKDAWERWQEIVNAAPEAMRLLLKDPNPEVVLSLLDLCSISEQGNFPCAFLPDHTEEVVSASLGDIAIPAEYFRTLGHKWIYEAGEVRRRLLRSLIAYFDWKHYLDSTIFEPRQYLRSLFSPLEPGDAVYLPTA